MPKEFLRVYDFTFEWILKHEGLDGLIQYWKGLAPIILFDLKERAYKEDIKGCYDYWSKVLREEDACFNIALNHNTLKLEITNCPSIRYLNSPVCSEYCRHCGVMYEELLKSVGLDYKWKRTGAGRCEIEVTKREII